MQSLSQLSLLHYKVYHSKVSCSAKLLTGQSLALESLSQQSLLQCKAYHSPVSFKRKLSPAYFTYLLLKSSGLELDFPILTFVLKQLFPFKNLFKTLLSRSSQRVPPHKVWTPLNKIRVSHQLINPPLPKPWVNPKMNGKWKEHERKMKGKWKENEWKMNGKWKENERKMNGKWKENERKMKGKWKENERKMKGKWKEHERNMKGKWKENERKMKGTWKENERKMKGKWKEN